MTSGMTWTAVFISIVFVILILVVNSKLCLHWRATAFTKLRFDSTRNVIVKLEQRFLAEAAFGYQSEMPHHFSKHTEFTAD